MAGSVSGAEAETAEAFLLPEILVTAKRAEAPATLIVREVTPTDIAALNAHTAGDALRLVPGVNVQYGGGSGDARAWIRGFRDRDTLVMVDGIPVASAFEGTVDLNEIAVSSLSHINVVKTAPSVIYGVNGMAGIIDIIPRPRVQGSELKVAAEIGENSSRLYRASYEAGSSSLSYFLSGSHQSADDYRLADSFDGALYQPPGKRVNSDFERNNFSLYLNAGDLPLGDSSVFYSVSDVERGVMPQSGVSDPDFERLQKSLRQTLGLAHRFGALPISVKAYYNGYESELAVYTDASYSEIDEIEKADDYSLGGKLYGTIQTSENNTVVVSGMLNRDVYKAEGVLNDTDRVELNTYNLSAENQYWLNRRLSVAAGGIFTWFKQEQSGEELTAFNPQLSVAYQFSQALSVRASAAQRTRFPRLRELYRRRYGNPELSEQSAENYELAMQYTSRGQITYDAALFYSELEDLIERPDRKSLYQNLDSVTIRGVEAAAGGWLNESWWGRLAYTYVDAAEDLPNGGERQLRSRPKHTAMAELRWQLPHGVLWSINGQYVSGLHDVDEESVYRELDSFFVVDTRVAWDITSQVQSYLAVSNAADENYEHKLGYPREGRAFRVGLEVVF
jgi:outer membrane cobalamin receptor